MAEPRKPYEFTGKVIKVGETVSVGKNGFTKREIVIEEARESKYPNLVQFTASKDKCEMLDDIQPGADVTVKFFVNGRRWEKDDGSVRYFVDLNISDLAVKSNPNAKPAANVPPPPSAEEIPEPVMGDDDSLPF